MTYIIAEVGSNYKSFDDAKDSIAMAKNCGADAVKFQMFTHEDLYGPQHTCITESNIKAWLPKLKAKADACKIDLMCTAFSPEGLRYVDQFVKAHKIASCELNYAQLLKAAKDTGKHVYLSVGAATWGDIAKALDILGRENTTLLYCSVEYPSRWHNLRIINTLRDRFGVNVGFSDHSFDLYSAVTASHVHGASVIEKHFKLRDDLSTPDSAHSLSSEQFLYMVELIRDRNAVMKMPNPGERAAVLRHKRRLVATRDIAKDETLEFDKNFGCYRVLEDDVNGMNGFDWEIVNGSRAKAPIRQGATIGPGNIER